MVLIKYEAPWCGICFISIVTHFTYISICCSSFFSICIKISRTQHKRCRYHMYKTIEKCKKLFPWSRTEKNFFIIIYFGMFIQHCVWKWIFYFGDLFFRDFIFIVRCNITILCKMIYGWCFGDHGSFDHFYFHL